MIRCAKVRKNEVKIKRQHISDAFSGIFMINFGQNGQSKKKHFHSQKRVFM